MFVGVKDLMLESLLNPHHDLVRLMTANLLRQIARSHSGHLAVLSLLDGGMAQAEQVPHHCTDFFKLLSDLLSSIATAPPEVSIALSLRFLMNALKRRHKDPSHRPLLFTHVSLSVCTCWEDINTSCCYWERLPSSVKTKTHGLIQSMYAMCRQKMRRSR